MKPGFVRIIAGKWRGRHLKIPKIEGLRPTPDRVRETLFNWLAPIIEGTYCLDLFAGSGVLGFEALSRGAAFVDMVDDSREVVTLLNEELKQFGATNAHIYMATIPKQLRKERRYDLVFLDPPYQENLLLPCVSYLEEHDFLADVAHVYLEAHRVISDNELPSNWHILKAKKAGQVYYHLARREK